MKKEESAKLRARCERIWFLKIAQRVDEEGEMSQCSLQQKAKVFIYIRERTGFTCSGAGGKLSSGKDGTKCPETRSVRQVKSDINGENRR